MKSPRPLAHMRAVAEDLVRELSPYCERAEIAGSIRREKPECSDIELVCVPKFGAVTAPGALFPRQRNLLDDYILRQPVRFGYRLDKNGRTANGERYKRLAFFGCASGDVPLDLFSVLPPAQWGVVFLIRTGSAEFSRRSVTQWRYGGTLPDDLRVQDGGLWRGREALQVPEESTFFELCGCRYVPPEERQ